MNKGEFDASIRELVPARWIPEEDKQRLSQASLIRPNPQKYHMEIANFFLFRL